MNTITAEAEAPIAVWSVRVLVAHVRVPGSLPLVQSASKKHQVLLSLSIWCLSSTCWLRTTLDLNPLLIVRRRRTSNTLSCISLIILRHLLLMAPKLNEKSVDEDELREDICRPFLQAVVAVYQGLESIIHLRLLWTATTIGVLLLCDHWSVQSESLCTECRGPGIPSSIVRWQR